MLPNGLMYFNVLEDKWHIVRFWVIKEDHWETSLHTIIKLAIWNESFLDITICLKESAVLLIIK